MGEPSNSEILQELQVQRQLIEKLLKVVPGAVSSEETKRGEREREEWGLEMARKTARGG